MPHDSSPSPTTSHTLEPPQSLPDPTSPLSLRRRPTRPPRVELQIDGDRISLCTPAASEVPSQASLSSLRLLNISPSLNLYLGPRTQGPPPPFSPITIGVEEKKEKEKKETEIETETSASVSVSHLWEMGGYGGRKENPRAGGTTILAMDLGHSTTIPKTPKRKTRKKPYDESPMMPSTPIKGDRDMARRRSMRRRRGSSQRMPVLEMNVDDM